MPQIEKEAQAKGESIKIAAIGKSTADQWKALSDEQKKVYNDKAVVSMKKYEDEKEAWMKTEQYKKYVGENALQQKRQRDAEAKVRSL